MYSINNDATGAIVYDPRLDDAILIDPVLHQKANAFGSLECVMHSNHPDFSNLKKRRTIYSVYKDDAINPLWKGIFISGDDGIDSSIELYFEDFMSVLRDSMQDAFIFTGQPVDMLSMLIDAHNAQVQPWQRVTLGHVTVTDPNDYVRRSSESELSTWEVIKTRLIDTLGGYVRMRYEGNVAYLDYLMGDVTDTDPYLNTSTQIIEFGENLTEFSRVISSADTYTACIPKGATLEQYNEEGELYSLPLTIESVNNGSKYLVNEEAVALYGFRCAPISETTWEDVTVPANLKTKGETYLHGKAVKLTNTIKLSAVDLRHLGAASDSYGYLDYVRVSVDPLGVESLFLLTEIKIPLADPSELSISLGETFMSLADRQHQQMSQIQQNVNRVEQTIPSTVQSAIQSEVTNPTGAVQTSMSTIKTDTMTEVSKTYVTSSAFEDYKKTVTSTFEQTEDGFEMRFETDEETVKKQGESMQAEFDKIHKYIRFPNGNIVLGVDGNPLILEIRHDRIAFKHNNVEIAYFSSGRLYVDNLHAVVSLILGSYAYMPDASGGMALKYIGT